MVTSGLNHSNTGMQSLIPLFSCHRDFSEGHGSRGHSHKKEGPLTACILEYNMRVTCSLPKNIYNMSEKSNLWFYGLETSGLIFNCSINVLIMINTVKNQTNTCAVSI